MFERKVFQIAKYMMQNESVLNIEEHKVMEFGDYLLINDEFETVKS